MEFYAAFKGGQGVDIERMCACRQFQQYKLHTQKRLDMKSY